MSTVFFVCAVAGGAILVLQLLLGLAGLDHHGWFDVDTGDVHVEAHPGDVHTGDTLNLLSVRALAAGLAFLGLVGMLVLSAGAPGLLALPAALLAGGTAAAAVAAAQRQMRKLERDGTVRLERAVGEAATVYLSIPGGMAGPGKVHVALQGRTVELQAVSQQSLPTGAAVVVVDLVGPDTVEVAPTLSLEV